MTGRKSKVPSIESPSTGKGTESLSEVKALQAELDRTRKALQESEEHFRFLFDHAPIGYQALDEEGRFIQVNKAWLEILAYTREEVIGKWFGDFLPPEFTEVFRERFPQFKAAGEIQTEFPMLHKDGSQRLISFKGRIEHKPDGTFKQTHCILSDITERKQVEEALQKSEQRLQSVFNTSSDGFVIIDMEGRVQMASPGVLTMYGIPREEDLLGQICTVFIVPEDRERAAANIARIFQGQKLGPIEYRVQHTDGHLFDVEVNADLIQDEEGRPSPLIFIMRDITERKQAEEALRKVSEHQKAILATIPDIIMQVDIEKIYTWGNRAGLEFFGEDVVGKAAPDFFEGEQDTLETIRSLYEGSEEVVYLESWQRRKDGEKRLLAWWCHTLKDGEGQVIGSLSSARDITEQRRVAEERLQVLGQLQSIFNASPDGMVLLDIEGRVCMASFRVVTMFGFDREEDLLGRMATDFIIPEEQECAAANIAHFFQGEKPGPIEHRGQHTDGHFFDIEVNAEAIQDAEGRPIQLCLVIRDITERKQAEEALRESRQITDGIIDAIPVRVFWKDKKLVYLGCNKAFAKDAGFANPKDLIGKTDSKLSWRKQAELFRMDDREVIRSGIPKYSYEETILTPDGRTLTLLTSKIPLRDAEGYSAGILGTYIDISDRKRIEEKLKVAEKRQRDIAANIPGAVYQFRFSRTGLCEVPYMSAGCEHLFEHPLVGLNYAALWFDHMPPEDLEAFHKSIAKAARKMERWSMEFRILKPDGQIKWLRGSANPQKNPKGVVFWNGVLLDITARKQAEEEVVGLARFPSESPNPVLRISQEGKILYSNKPGRMFLTDWKVKVGGDVPKNWYHWVQEALESKKPFSHEEGFGEKIFLVMIMPIPAAGYVNLYAFDITARKQAEEEVAKQLKELQRWQAVTMGREGRVGDLKREVNALAKRLDQPPPYKSTEDNG